MKKVYWPALISLALLEAGYGMSPSEQAKPIDVRVMTFNIRTGLVEDGPNHWDQRKDFVYDVISQCAPDVLGVQEACRFQLDDLGGHLPEYGEIGIGRDGGSQGEYSSILYRKQRFTVDESGTFWLSDTPSTPSAHWGNHYRRICTWARLLDQKSARAFYVYNTHLDHQSQTAREKAVRLIMKHINDRTHPDPFVLIGDFNAGEDNPAIEYLMGTGTFDVPNPIPLIDSFRTHNPHDQGIGTSHRFTGFSYGPKVDYIWVTPNTRILEAAIIRAEREGRYPSDHYPVTAQLQFE